MLKRKVLSLALVCAMVMGGAVTASFAAAPSDNSGALLFAGETGTTDAAQADSTDTAGGTDANASDTGNTEGSAGSSQNADNTGSSDAGSDQNSAGTNDSQAQDGAGYGNVVDQKKPIV